MRKSMPFFLIIIPTILLFCSSAGSTTLSFSPSSASVSQSGSIDIDIVLSDLGIDVDLAIFDLTVNYDDTVLSFDSYVLGSGLGDIISDEADDWSSGDIGGGQIHLSELSWLWDLSFQGDPFTLATITFTGAGVGTSSLSFSDVYLVDASLEDANEISAELTTGQIQVFNSTPVPEPASALLLTIGLLGLLGAYRNKK